MLELSTSYREQSLQDTLVNARQIAATLGITRVTDTTRLDKIGVPVFASIRPAASSLCVNAGKGLHSIEAEVGAYMEAIEYAYSEHPGVDYGATKLSIADTELQLPPGIRLQDFCPVFGAHWSASDVIAVRKCEQLFDKAEVYLPEALVLHPAKQALGRRLFGSSTNGLASGNSANEATLHALFELLERDVVSFSKAGQPRERLSLNNIPSSITELLSAVDTAGLEMIVLYLPNSYGLPCFEAQLIDTKDNVSFHNISAGYGLHFSAAIALSRAVTEAIQSRLSHIHGGRDDLVDRLGAFEGNYDQERLQAIEAFQADMRSKSETVDFELVPDLQFEQQESHDLVSQVMRILHDNGIKHVFRYVLSPVTCPLTVVKVIVPGLEHIKRGSKRLGPRITQYLLNDG